MKRFLALILGIFLVFGTLAACNDPNDGDNGGIKELNIYLWNNDGKTPDGFQSVIDKYNAEYAQANGATLKFSFDLQDDFKQNLNLSMSAQSATNDLIFDAPWVYLTEFAKKGYYYNLESYFGNDAYPGLKKAFDQEYIDNNKYSNGLYGIPLTETFSDIAVVYLRKDWRERCALDTAWSKPANIGGSKTYADIADGIDDFEEFEYFLYWVKSKIGSETIPSNAVPFLANNDGNYGPMDVIIGRNLPANTANDKVLAGIKDDLTLVPGLTSSLYIAGGQVRAARIDYEDPTANPDGLTAFPAGFDTEDTRWQVEYEIVRRWQQAGLIDGNIMAVTDAQAQFKAGKGAAAYWSINDFDNTAEAMKNTVTGAELEIFVADKALREKTMGYVATDFKAWNYLAIPKTVSPARRDLVMKFLDWLFASRENHDLFQYGIKGVHWDEAKDEYGQYMENTITKIGMQAYTFPGYVLTWNPNYIRLPVGTDPKVYEYSIYMYDKDRYVGKLYPGFNFDHLQTSALTSALANTYFATYTNQRVSFWLGQYADPINSWNNIINDRNNNTAVQNDIRLIKEALIQQMQDYIDNL